MNYLSGEKLKLNKSAFTLLEMIVSMSLIVIITAVFIANYHSNNKRTDLTMTAQTLVSNIHAAQNNTLGLVKYGTETSVVPAGGWGIHFNMASSTQYVLFADLDRPASDEPGQVWEADEGYMEYNELDGEGDIASGAKIVNLPTGIEIDSLSFEDGGAVSTSDTVDITFLPPDPSTNIFDGAATSTAVNIILKDMATGALKRIRVNFLGLAEVVDMDFVYIDYF